MSRFARTGASPVRPEERAPEPYHPMSFTRGEGVRDWRRWEGEWEGRKEGRKEGSWGGKRKGKKGMRETQ